MKQNKKNLLEVIKKRPNAVVAIVASISIAIVGYVLLATFAADAPHVEVETATITGNAEKVEDQTASNGEAIQFGATSAGTPPTAGECTSGGSGGSLTDQLNQSFTAASLTSEYHIYASHLSGSEPTGLLIQFHGDGAFEFKNPNSSFALPGIVDAGKQHDMLVMAALSPDTSTETWWRDGAANAAWVRELMQTVAYDGYNIDKNKVWLVGYSGGAQFITKFYTPAHSDTICSGGAIIFGGGGAPAADPENYADSFTQNFKMHWYTGEDDIAANAGDGYDALADSKRGYNHYLGLGFSATAEHPAGVNHGNINFGEIVQQQLDVAYP